MVLPYEHWDEIDLIDMNGRMYDPTVGRFLSPDPYVQDATNPQNFNRYAYCLNNPLKYTDPSGYLCVDLSGGEKDLAIKEDDEYWSLAEHLRDFTFSGSSGGGLRERWNSWWNSFTVGAGGMQFSYNCYYIVGYGIDVQIGQTKNGKNYVSMTINGGYGIDLGCSVGFFSSYYTHGENTRISYSPETMEGYSWFASGGMGIGVGVSSSIISPDVLQNNDYHKWTTISFLMGTASLGGCWGSGITYILTEW